MEYKRWYDNNPIVKLAVNYLEESDNSLRDYCCDFIIEKSRNSGYVLVVNNYEYFWQRWQDQNVKYFLAMEYLKIIDDETQREICEEIVKYIEEARAAASAEQK